MPYFQLNSQLHVVNASSHLRESQESKYSPKTSISATTWMRQNVDV